MKELFYFLMVLPVFSQTIVDYDMAIGKKPISQFANFSSRLNFTPNKKGIEKYFSNYRQTENRPNFLKFENSGATEEFVDLDLTELFETWRHFEKGNLIFEAKIHENKEVIQEKSFYGEDGQILYVWIDRKLNGLFDEIHFYHNKRIFKTLRDENQDGLFETELVFFLPGQEKANWLSQEKAIPTPKFPANALLYFVGIYETQKEIVPATNIEKAIETAFPILVNQKNFVFTELAKKKQQPNRLNLFAAAKKALPNKIPPGYLLYGEVFEGAGRLQINIKIYGPEAKDLFFTKHFVYSSREFTTSQFIQDLKASLSNIGIATHSALAQP